MSDRPQTIPEALERMGATWEDDPEKPGWERVWLSERLDVGDGDNRCISPAGHYIRRRNPNCKCPVCSS